MNFIERLYEIEDRDTREYYGVRRLLKVRHDAVATISEGEYVNRKYIVTVPFETLESYASHIRIKQIRVTWRLTKIVTREGQKYANFKLETVKEL